ncbi:MAG: beta-aspartyl-peptidase [Sutterella sp.]|nr:beta-aspartyl-peptidase [Sutterella sp.]
MTAVLIKNADVYAPEHLGTTDVFIVNDKIVAVGKDLTVNVPGMETVDAKGRVMMPGVIDQHIHVTGGGGEAGPVSRCPEASLHEFIEAGITTVVGVSGTDSETRSIENLLAKVRALKTEGLTTYMWTSNYAFPVTTITGTVRRELLTIPEVIGVKIALGDHRSSFPTEQDILHLLSDIRVGGMISGKTGFLHVHLGDLGNTAYDIIDACCDAGMPIKHIRPTHCARKDLTWERSLAFARRGGMIDLTAGPCICGTAADAVFCALEDGVAADKLTLSTDAHGSFPRFDDKGEMIGLDVCPINGAWPEFQKLVEKLGFEKAIGFVSTNLAKGLNLAGKGQIKDGMDADLLLVNDACEITDMFARGRSMMRASTVVAKGMYEK